MSFMNKLKNLFGSREPVETSLENLDSTFYDLRKDEIQESRERREELLEKSETIVSSIEDSLEEIKDFEDDENLDIVEDVAESFYNSRKNLVRNLQLPEDMKAHSRKFNEFVEEFNDVSMKEGAVMQRIHSKSGELGDSIEEAATHAENLEEFNENGFKPVLKLREIREKKENLQEVKDEIESLKDDLDSIEFESIEDKISRKKDELNELESGSEMEELKHLKSHKEKISEKKEAKRSEIERNISAIERGLKKALYQIENTETGFSGDKSDLEDLLDRNFMENPGAGKDLPEVADILDEKDVLSGRQLEKFRNGIRKLEDLDKKVQEIKVLKDEVNDLDDRIKRKDVIEEKEKIEEELKNLESDLEDRKNQASELESKIEEKEDRLQRGIDELEARLESELGREVELGRE
ncbi:MAG: hypothetical protein ABEK10_01960 [Candidatus Nanosalina sp.]